METGLGKMRNWWSNKYKLPPNHDLFLDRTPGSLHKEMYEDLFIKKDDLEEAYLESDGKSAEMLLKQINGIKEILGEQTESADPLVDKWEKELAEGKTPDLSEGYNAQRR